jgi:hypothetical protein
VEKTPYGQQEGIERGSGGTLSAATQWGGLQGRVVQVLNM